MKKITLVLLIVILVVFSLGYSQELVIGTPQTISWDAVTVSQGIITYEVAIKDSLNNITALGETAGLTYSYDVPSGGEYVVGVRTKLVIGTTTYYSDWNWSDVDGVSTPNPFVLLQAVPVPLNLRR